ncbi:hypothetical protein TWF281_007378 [Arthrobotrys megalospora]
MTTSMTPANRLLAISLYRACLRELPPMLTRMVKLSGSRTPSVAATRTPLTRRLSLHNYLRVVTRAVSSDRLPQAQPEITEILRIRQMVRYLEAQRSYIELLERYNVGLVEGNQDRIRRAARRVGLNIAE